MPEVKHHPNCSADYPEKIETEAPQQITVMDCEDFLVYQCVDCGAFVTVDKDNNND
jgi:hypothetical protein